MFLLLHLARMTMEFYGDICSGITHPQVTLQVDGGTYSGLGFRFFVEGTGAYFLGKRH
jgi:hypothetical protein